MVNKSTYETIIIGAGIGGLTTGNFLAKEGQQVLILEKHFQIGGYVTAYKRRGYPLDVVHVISGLKSGAPLDNIFKHLRLYEKVQFIEIEKTFIYKFPEYSISCYTEIEKYKDELKNYFPEEKQNIDNIMDEMTEVWKQTQSSYYNPSFLNMITYPIRFPKLVKYQNWTFEKFLDKFTTNFTLKKVLSAGWGYNGLDMSRISALSMVSMLMSYHTGGAWYPKGGYQNLSNAFAENFKKLGGSIKTNSEVKKIIFQDNKAVGVETKSGEEFFAKNIVSNSDTKKTFTLLIENDFVPNRLYQRVTEYSQSVSGVVVHLVVDMEIPDDLCCGCIMYFPKFDTEENQFALWERGKIELDPNSMGFGMAISTLKDKEMVSDGKHVLDLIYMPAPYDYFIKNREEDYVKLKEDVAKKIIKAAENVIPDLGKQVIVTDVSTPLTYERYTNATKGGWYDIDCSPKQALLGRIRNKTPIKGLYLTGAKTFPGSGMFAAINAGLFTADAILKGKLTHRKMLFKI